MTKTESGLYDYAVPEGNLPGPRPEPGTSLTASVETIDNDRTEGITFAAGILR